RLAGRPVPVEASSGGSGLAGVCGGGSARRSEIQGIETRRDSEEWERAAGHFRQKLLFRTGTSELVERSVRRPAERGSARRGSHQSHGKLQHPASYHDRKTNG